MSGEPACRDLERGRDLAVLLEKTGKLVRAEEYAVIAPHSPESDALARFGTVENPTVDMAISAYMAAAKDQGIAEATFYKKHLVFDKLVRDFCVGKGIRFLSELDLNALREWRSSWNLGDLSRYKRQKQAIGFLWFCERAGWLPRNFATNVTKGLGKIQVKATQTGYFLPSEYKTLIDATYIYSDRPSVDKHNSLTVGGERIRAVTEVMRWTGLRIRDAVTLEKNRLSHDSQTGLSSVIIHAVGTRPPGQPERIRGAIVGKTRDRKAARRQAWGLPGVPLKVTTPAFTHSTTPFSP